MSDPRPESRRFESLGETVGTTEGGPGFTRRRLLAGSGMAGLGLLAVACGKDDKKKSATTEPSSNTTPTTAGAAGGDAKVAVLAAGLEVLAVDTYKAALDAATSGKLGAVPPAVAEYVKTALSHHQEHLSAWNGVLKSAGQPEVTQPNAQLKPTIDAEFAKVKDVVGAAKLALMLEDIAAQTYLKAIPTLKSKEAVKTAGSIQIVDQQHQSILLYALGMYPVPEVFQKTDKAATG